MPEPNIRLAIKNVLLGVPGIGKIYDTQKNIVSENDIKLNFVSKNVLNVFLIGDNSSKEEKIILGFGIPGSHLVTHFFKIDGYYGFNESFTPSVPSVSYSWSTIKTSVTPAASSEINTYSRTAFSSLISAITGAFRTNLTLNNTCFRHNYIEVRVNNQEMFCGILCHHTELVLQVEERI